MELHKLQSGMAELAKKPEYKVAQAYLAAELADLARSSISASLASPTDKVGWLAEVDAWLATEPESSNLPGQYT